MDLGRVNGFQIHRGLMDPLYFFFFLIILSHYSSTNPKNVVAAPAKILISYTKSHLPTIIFFEFLLIASSFSSIHDYK
ncbi:hypothetical protein HanIR_Chr01g0031171 [Helianthus annuus]|nr:hypothetical protein HanIR_Chr01g0031171 [Helianthus annuus]